MAAFRPSEASARCAGSDCVAMLVEIAATDFDEGVVGGGAERERAAAGGGGVTRPARMSVTDSSGSCVWLTAVIGVVIGAVIGADRTLAKAGGGTEPPLRLDFAASLICRMRSMSTCPS